MHEREEFRLLVGDIHGLPETQRTALVLREMDALSYEQIAEAMETTVPSVKSLLVRARVSLAEAAEARMLTCEEVRIELGEVAEGLRRRPGALVRRHLRACERCSNFKGQLGETSKALAAILPIGFAPLVLLRKAGHPPHRAFRRRRRRLERVRRGRGRPGRRRRDRPPPPAPPRSWARRGGGFLSASVGAIATKAAAGLAAAALVTAGAVEVDQPARSRPHHHPAPTHVAAVRPRSRSPPRRLHMCPVAHRCSPTPTSITLKHPRHKPAAKTAATAKKPLNKQTAGATTKPKAKAKPKVCRAARRPRPTRPCSVRRPPRASPRPAPPGR